MSDLLFGFCIGILALPASLGFIEIYTWFMSRKKGKKNDKEKE